MTIRPTLFLILAGALVAAARPTAAVEFYNVSSYASPQAAINAAAAAGGGVVRFPCGATTISQPLQVTTAGITLEGCGIGGTVLSTTAQTGNIIELGNTATPFSPCGGVRDMTIHSNGRTGGYAIAVAGCQEGILDNLHIETNGGNGIRFSDSSDSLAAIFFVRAVTIWIAGAYTAIQVDGSSERHFTNLWLHGDQTAGSKGIVMAATGGDWYRDVESVLFEIGISVVPAASKLVGWVNFDNVLADQNTLHGFYFAGAGTTAGVSCVRCWSSSNGLTNVNARGMYISKGDGLTFTDSRIINNGGHGVEVTSGASNLSFAGGLLSGNCVAGGCSSGQAHGIVLTGTSGFRIHGVRAGQSVGTGNKQGYGIYVNSGCTNYIVTNNDTRLNVTGGILNVPGISATRIVSGNI